MLNDPIVIVSAARTPMGAFQGELKGFAAPELGAAAIRAAIERAGVKPDQVEEVIMGCVLPAGLGQAPARQASTPSHDESRSIWVVPPGTAWKLRWWKWTGWRKTRPSSPRRWPTRWSSTWPASVSNRAAWRPA